MCVHVAVLVQIPTSTWGCNSTKIVAWSWLLTIFGICTTGNLLAWHFLCYSSDLISLSACQLTDMLTKWIQSVAKDMGYRVRIPHTVWMTTWALASPVYAVNANTKIAEKKQLSTSYRRLWRLPHWQRRYKVTSGLPGSVFSIQGSHAWEQRLLVYIVTPAECG